MTLPASAKTTSFPLPYTCAQGISRHTCSPAATLKTAWGKLCKSNTERVVDELLNKNFIENWADDFHQQQNNNFNSFFNNSKTSLQNDNCTTT